MVVVMVMLGLAPAFFAVEDDKVLAEGVKRGNEYAGQHGEIGKPLPGRWLIFTASIMLFFGIEAGEKRCADKRQVANQHSQPGNRHIFAQTAHIAHVLVVVHADDDRPAARNTGL